MAAEPLPIGLPAALRSELETLAVQSYPHEVCGLLVGHRHRERRDILRVTRAENLNRDRPGDRYVLDPAAFLAAEKQAADLDGEVIGVWHSHPDHAAVPSETDREAAWSEYSYLIVSVREGVVRTMRSWRLQAGRFVEERLQS